MMLAKVRQYGAKVKTEDLSNTLTLTLSETAQRRSSSVVSNRSTASITDKFGVASLTEPAILNDANVALVDAMHHSVVMDALTMTLIEDDDDLLGTVNSYIKLRRLGAPSLPEQPLLLKKRGRHSKLILDGPPLKRCKTEAADSRHAKVSGGRTKKDKDSEDSDTGSDVLRLRRRDRAAARAQLAERKRLGKEAQLKKTRDEEELAKAKKEKEEKEAWERETQLDGLLDSDDYCLDSSLDIDPEDDSEDEEATTAKDLAREQKERLKALLNANGDGNRTLHSGRLTDAYILYFKELLSDNSGIFANAIGMGKTRAMVLALCPTKAIMMTGWGRAADAWKNEVVAMDLVNFTWCDLSDPLALRFCFFSDSPLENIGRLTKEKAMEMRIDTTDAISKALAAANKLVAPQSYVLGGATKHRLAPSAARFVIVCGFGKVDKHVFRAYNTMSVTAQRTIIRKGGSYVEKRAILLPTLNGLAMAKQWRNMIANVKHDVSEHESSYEDILEKEGLNELEASRRVIFNCFKMQAIASYPALATLKAAQFKTYSSCKVKRFTSNSVKDLFTNLSKDYFLVREARAITKSSLNIAAEDAAKAANILLLPKEVCAKILIGSYKPIVQAVTWLGLREKFGDESVLRDLDGPWIIVALMAFAEAITLTEATHVVIIEPQDRQNTQD
ncbi:hypothetical protein HBI81_067350 [Parastagonospora nodorum]|nr:hypothetical protein HBI81_067350 [Parastagonospora nodorum]